MKGRVGKRGRSWYYVVDVGRDVEGNRRQQWKGGFSTRREAEEALSRVAGEVREGNYVAPSKQLYRDFLQEWTAAKRSELKETSFAFVERIVRNQVVPGLGDLRLQAPTPERLRDFYESLRGRDSRPEASITSTQ